MISTPPPPLPGEVAAWLCSCVKVRSLPLSSTSQCHLQRDAGVTSSLTAVAFKARGQQNKAEIPVCVAPTTLTTPLLPPGTHLFWAILKVTYQHLPRSFCLPFKTGFDVADSHVATFLKEGRMGTESVVCAFPENPASAQGRLTHPDSRRNGLWAEKAPLSIEEECLEVPAVRGRGKEG